MAALKGDEETDVFQQDLLDSYVALYGRAFAPCTALSAEALHLRCVGIVGAGEAIAREMIRERVDERIATETLTSLIVGWLSPKSPGGGG